MTRSNNDVELVVNDMGFILLNQYFDETRHRVIEVEDSDGYEYSILFKDFVKTNGRINFVSKGNPYSLVNISLYLKYNISNIELCEDNIYIGNKNKLKFYHLTCGEYFYSSWNSIWNGQGCGICHGKQIGSYNNLMYVRPDLAAEWHTDNMISPEEVTPSSRLFVWWLCPNGHKYISSIGSRTNHGTGCKKCSDQIKESRIATLLKEYFCNNYNAISEFKECINPKTGRYLPYDICFNTKHDKIYVEIQGEQHYLPYRFGSNLEDFNYRKYLDKVKRKHAEKNGIYIEVDLRKIKTYNEGLQMILKNIGI